MEEKVTVIIPNYNGRELLAKNLPKVIENCPGCQIIIIDDASTDDSVNFLKKNYKKIKLFVNHKNQGFSKTVNRGVENAKTKYVLLLNSDVSPRPNFLESALSQFVAWQHPRGELFAVSLADYSHEAGKVVVRGRGGAKFKHGFINHFALQAKAGETLWVSGGSSLVNREIFNELGGFDPIFAPFYWEDIDLSYRARKAGYICIFDPDSKVDHYHEEGAIKKTKTQFTIKTVAYKNQFIFVWKNISDYFLLIQHFLWFPYHFAKALVSWDLPFFTGFLWALSQMPKLVFSGQVSDVNCQVSDEEIISEFKQ